MDYTKHYYRLIWRAQHRQLSNEIYVENHHIIPKCIGGEDKANNIVALTPEEHYTAHQLLVKMYPDKSGLVWAAIQMSRCSKGYRPNNKLYGWLRRKYQHVAKQRLGNKNGCYGRRWYYDPETHEAGKYIPNTQPIGWKLGRKPKQQRKCVICGTPITGSHKIKYCEEHREQINSNTRKKQTFNGDEERLKQLLREGYSLTKSLNIMGYQNYPLSNTKTGAGRWAVKVRDSLK